MADSEHTNRGSLARLEEVSERLSHQQIREMADVFRLSDEDLDEKRIIYPKMRDKRVLNTFREIRTKLVEQSKHKNFTLMVTSVCEGGGGSFVSTNLAAAIALDQGKTALMVDCNLYSPSSDHFLDGPQLGFSDFLENPSITIEEIIYATGVPRLRLIPVGKATDIGPEYYTSYRMMHFVDELSTRYADRYVVLDVPPVGTSPDARILSDLCDFAVLVVPYGKITEDQLRTAVESISREKLVGMIFNHQ